MHLKSYNWKYHRWGHKLRHLEKREASTLYRRRKEDSDAMRKTRLLLVVLCTFVSAFVLGVQVAFNSEQQQQQLRLRVEAQAPGGVRPFFTADGAEWLDSWSTVSPNVHVFSAYLDPRSDAAVVRVIGLMRLNPTLKVTCACLLDGPARSVQAKVEFLQDHHHAPFDGVFVLCPYGPSSEAPRSVRVVVNGTEAGTSRSFPVHFRSPAADEDWDSLAVCVRPFYNGVPKVRDIRHFIAYYVLHGVGRFTFYEYRSGQDVRSYLWSLRDKLKLDLLPWSLPAAKRSWALAQNAFTQDCLCRHANASRRVLIVDLDEFVLPTKRLTVSQLVASLPASKVCLVVRNVFLARAPSAEGRPFIFESVNRSRRVWAPGLRSKYVADPLRVLEGGIHFCRRFPDGVPHRDRQLTVSEALLFHYRGLRGEAYRRDDSMLRWRDALMSSPLMPGRRGIWAQLVFRARHAFENTFDALLRLIYGPWSI